MRDVKRMTWTLALVAAIPLWAGGAQAAWLDIDDEAVNKWVGSNSTVSGDFDIVDAGNDCILIVCDQDGFVPGTDVANPGYVAFAFYGWEVEYTIALGAGDQTLTDPPDWAFFGIRLEVGSLDASSLEDLNEDGQIAWSVTNDGPHRFKLKYAKLLAKRDSAAVPEPRAAALFVLGSLLVGSFMRLRQRAKLPSSASR